MLNLVESARLSSIVAQAALRGGGTLADQVVRDLVGLARATLPALGDGGFRLGRSAPGSGRVGAAVKTWPRAASIGSFGLLVLGSFARCSDPGVSGTDASGDGVKARPVYYPAICDDGNPCTVDTLYLGACVYGPVEGPCSLKPCLTDTDCPGQVCDIMASVCFPCTAMGNQFFHDFPGIQPEVQHGCTGGRYCRNHVCRYGEKIKCLDGATCENGQKCVQFYTPQCYECGVDEDCPLNTQCKLGLCVPDPWFMTLACFDPFTGVANRSADMFCGWAKGFEATCIPDLCSKPACVGNVVLPCEPDGSGYDASKKVACASGTVCKAGACVVP